MEASPLLIITPTLGSSIHLDETVASLRMIETGIHHVIVCPESMCNLIAQRFPTAMVVPECIGGGMYGAINEGISASVDISWDFLTYINDDDTLLLGFLNNLAHARSSKCDVCYGDVIAFRDNGSSSSASIFPVLPLPRGIPELVGRDIVPVQQPGTLYSRSLIESGPGFDESFRYSADLEIVLRALKSGHNVCYRRNRIAQFRIHATQLSQANLAMRTERLNLAAKCDTSWRGIPLLILYRTYNTIRYLHRMRSGLFRAKDVYRIGRRS